MKNKKPLILTLMCIVAVVLVIIAILVTPMLNKNSNANKKYQHGDSFSRLTTNNEDSRNGEFSTPDSSSSSSPSNSSDVNSDTSNSNNSTQETQSEDTQDTQNEQLMNDKNTDVVGYTDSNGKMHVNKDKINKINEEVASELATETETEDEGYGKSTSSDVVADKLKISKDVDNIKVIVYRINQLALDNNYKTVKVWDKPSKSDIRDAKESKGSLVYVVELDYDFYWITYYYDSNEATSDRDYDGSLASLYIADTEEDDNDVDTEVVVW